MAGGVKQYDSLENMYADISNAHTDDLAVVYANASGPIQSDVPFTKVYFPDVIDLGEEMNVSKDGEGVSLAFFKYNDKNYVIDVDRSSSITNEYAQVAITITDNTTMMRKFTIHYATSDGIHFTKDACSDTYMRINPETEEIIEQYEDRTDTIYEVEFPIEIYYSLDEEYRRDPEIQAMYNGTGYVGWMHILGSFFYAEDKSFDGIYQFNGNNFIMLPNTGLNSDMESVFKGQFYGINSVQIGSLGQTNNLNLSQLKTRVNLYSNLSNLGLQGNDINLDNMFIGLKSIPNLYNGNITSMANTFNKCTTLTLVPNFNTSNVTNMSGTFYNCYNLTNIPNFNTHNVTDMSHMFCYCYNLTTIPNFNTSKVEYMSWIFEHCFNLVNVPNFNLSNVIDITGIFCNCNSLVSVPSFDTSKVNSAGFAFYGCTNLVDVPQFNTSNITNMYVMFEYCNNLSNASIQNIVNMCLNSNVVTERKNLSNKSVHSPLNGTKFDNSYYSDRWAELDAAGWKY